MSITVTRAQLAAVAPQTQRVVLDRLVPAFNKALARFGITDPHALATILTQGSVESGGFTRRIENTNYDAQGLANTWPGRYSLGKDRTTGHQIPNGLALRLSRHPQAIANNTYAGRNGNGPEASGDGSRLRGQTFGQLTGRDNLTAFARDMGMGLDAALTYGQTDEGAVMGLVWFFATRGIAQHVRDPRAASEAWNGGKIGLPERMKLWPIACAACGVKA